MRRPRPRRPFHRRRGWPRATWPGTRGSTRPWQAVHALSLAVCAAAAAGALHKGAVGGDGDLRGDGREGRHNNAALGHGAAGDVREHSDKGPRRREGADQRGRRRKSRAAGGRGPCQGDGRAAELEHGEGAAARHGPKPHRHIAPRGRHHVITSASVGCRTQPARPGVASRGTPPTPLPPRCRKIRATQHRARYRHIWNSLLDANRPTLLDYPCEPCGGLGDDPGRVYALAALCLGGRRERRPSRRARLGHGGLGCGLGERKLRLRQRRHGSNGLAVGSARVANGVDDEVGLHGAAALESRPSSRSGRSGSPRPVLDVHRVAVANPAVRVAAHVDVVGATAAMARSMKGIFILATGRHRVERSLRRGAWRWVGECLEGFSIFVVVFSIWGFSAFRHLMPGWVFCYCSSSPVQSGGST